MKKTVLLFIAILIAKLLLQHFLIHPAYDLQRDEYLHLDQGRHLQWGYISVPPITSWISYVILLLGGGVFWVKFFPALFGTLTILLVWKMVEELNGKFFALSLSFLALFFSVLLRINILYQPNSSDIFFWTLTYFAIIKYTSTNNSKWLYLAGVIIGFGMLSKYNIAFLVIGLVTGLLITNRNIFLQKSLYFAAAIGLIILLPNLLWQIKNHFPTLHQLDELSRTQLVNVKRTDFIKEQILYFLNSFFIILAGIIGLLIYPAFRKYRFVLLSYITVIALYLFLKAKSYYAIGLYPVLIAFGSVYFERLFEYGRNRYWRPVVFVLVLALFVPMFIVAFPIQSPAATKQNNKIYKAFGLLRWEDGKDHDLPQDFADMTGWSEMAHLVDSAYGLLPDKHNTVVICDNYGQAGAVNYYSKFKDINAVSMNADYINWIPLAEPIKNVILVKWHNDKDPDRNQEKPLFDSVALIGRDTNPYSRESGASVYLLTGAKADINSRISKEIRERKEP
jgi:4-amino-4-deoxy-L-arabinose transferase-like glycosyltransferase